MRATDIFIDGIEKLLNSNVVTADKDIRAFLVSLSSDEKLREVVIASKEGFRFDEEFRRVFNEGNQLPNNDEKKVALITGLLYCFDVGRVSLGDLLIHLYPTFDGAKAYSHFLSDYIQPFAESFVRLLVEEPVEEVKVTTISVYDKMNEDITAVIKDLVAAIASANFDKETVECIAELSNGLIYVLSYNDALLTRNSYYGLMNTLRLYQVEIPQQEELHSILKLYGVL